MNNQWFLWIPQKSEQLSTGASQVEHWCPRINILEPQHTHVLALISSGIGATDLHNQAGHSQQTIFVVWAWMLQESLAVEAERHYHVVYGPPDLDMLDKLITQPVGVTPTTNLIASIEESYNIDTDNESAFLGEMANTRAL